MIVVAIPNVRLDPQPAEKCPRCFAIKSGIGVQFLRMRKGSPRLTAHLGKGDHRWHNLQVIAPIGRNGANHQRHAVAIDQAECISSLFCGDRQDLGRWPRRRRRPEPAWCRCSPSPNAVASRDSAWSTINWCRCSQMPARSQPCIGCALFRHSSPSRWARLSSDNSSPARTKSLSTRYDDSSAVGRPAGPTSFSAGNIGTNQFVKLLRHTSVRHDSSPCESGKGIVIGGRKTRATFVNLRFQFFGSL